MSWHTQRGAHMSKFYWATNIWWQWILTCAGVVALRVVLLVVKVPHSVAHVVAIAACMLALVLWLRREPELHRELERIKFEAVFAEVLLETKPLSSRPTRGKYEAVEARPLVMILFVLFVLPFAFSIVSLLQSVALILDISSASKSEVADLNILSKSLFIAIFVWPLIFGLTMIQSALIRYRCKHGYFPTNAY